MTKYAASDRPYESMFICPSETSQKTIDEFVEKIKKTLSETKGTLHSVQVWGRRRLTYPIKRAREGLYVYVDFNGGSNSVKEFNVLYRVSDMILRHVTVEKQKFETRPSKVPVEAVAATPAATAVPASAPTQI